MLFIGDDVDCPESATCVEGTIVATCQCMPGYAARMTRNRGLVCEGAYHLLLSRSSLFPVRCLLYYILHAFLLIKLLLHITS